MNPSPAAPRATATSEWVLTLLCPDRPGTVFEVSRFLLDRECNIAESQQVLDTATGRFFMRVQFQLNGSRPVDGADLRREFTAVADAAMMHWRLTSTADKQRVLIMVSKYGHCLNDLLYRTSTGDLDIVVTSEGSDSATVMDHFVAYGEVAEVISKGETRATVKLRGGLQVDLRAVEPDAYGAALLYFTGSKAHNIELRKIAQEKSYKLNEYGLFKGTRRVAGKTEQEIYAKLGLDWIPPELREARGEIALAREHRLPHLVEVKDIRGDLQMHTSATDGKGAIEDMAHAARALGYQYIAITDHSKRVTMALGLDAKRLREQWKAIDAWNATSRRFTILKSIELDILENGKLDLPDDVLAEADYVVATIHYGINQTEKELTRRLVGAAEHAWVDAIGHPTGRLVGKREPYAFDFEALCRACAASGCLLELNGHPERMDLPDTLAAAGKQHGVRFVLSTDSHQPGNLPFMKYAVYLARRAGLEAGDILNTRPLAEFRKGLKRAKP